MMYWLYDDYSGEIELIGKGNLSLIKLLAIGHASDTYGDCHLYIISEDGLCQCWNSEYMQRLVNDL